MEDLLNSMKAKPMSPSKSGRNIQSTDTSFVPEEARKHVRNIGLKTFHFQKHCNRTTICNWARVLFKVSPAKRQGVFT